MALHIRHPEADHLARELAAKTGKPLTEVVIEALRAMLRREQSRAESGARLKDEIMAISRRAAARPRTGRTADEIIGYDERGLPR